MWIIWSIYLFHLTWTKKISRIRYSRFGLSTIDKSSVKEIGYSKISYIFLLVYNMIKFTTYCLIRWILDIHVYDSPQIIVPLPIFRDSCLFILKKRFPLSWVLFTPVYNIHITCWGRKARSLKAPQELNLQRCQMNIHGWVNKCILYEYSIFS